MAKEQGYLRPADKFEAPHSRELYGRDREVQLFIELLETPSTVRRMISVYGTGGVGKTVLLREFDQLARQRDIPFVMVDTRLFAHTPAEFCIFLLRTLHTPIPGMMRPNDTAALTELCREVILGAGKPFVLALDTFEEIGEMEHWLRDSFINRMPEGIIIILSGRFALHPSWRAFPAWQRTIYPLPIRDLDYEAARSYLLRCGIASDETIRSIWLRTRGHPLSLALLASTSLVNVDNEGRPSNEDAWFSHIVQTWLREVPDSDMRELVESAAVARHFNQEMLSRMLGRPVTTEQFRRLISYSFIQRMDRGWLLHELLREAISKDLRMRMPERYNRIWQRCLQYYSNKLKQSARNKSVSWENAEFLYYIGNQFVHFLMYRQWVSYSVEPLGPGNWKEAEQYIERRRRTAKDSYIPFSAQDGTHIQFCLSRQESLLVLDQIRLQELYELEPGSVKLIRNGEDEVCGLIEIIPIHAGTIDYLRTARMSRAYFTALPEELLLELAVQPPSHSGYFVKILDVYDFADDVMMHASLSTLISHILSTGYIVAAPIGNPISHAICTSLGLEQAAGTGNLDYDNVTPAPYYILDTRGNKVNHYVDKMIAALGMQEEGKEAEAEGFAEEALLSLLSRREREVLDRVILGRSNLELARDLCLSEVTVKKHLANIFRKLEVKSRTQLIHKVSGRT
ncbi:LuxR C-terminal-related transcriptional regulator [Paenibacillus sp. JDR-2]|uniref:LuxR C-terminal-related transcriptional regulator n=1 Tax=Paenibacillus sp. (strain JDR-2) TaxID=324057 RepID=UPI000166B0F1|nr:LuxR C-terminal-related transcriptional regulator [Paenibacillus sp. JDR-2]ACS99217.1 transcriptional regulator, LuxR family [Paenibacillus sp. JDR-2]